MMHRWVAFVAFQVRATRRSWWRRRGWEREREDCLGTLLVLNGICVFFPFIDIISLCLEILRVSATVFVKKKLIHTLERIFSMKRLKIVRRYAMMISEGVSLSNGCFSGLMKW
jgi:hypothetical protein